MIAQVRIAWQIRVVEMFNAWPVNPGPALFVAILIVALALLALLCQLVNCSRYARGANRIIAIRRRLSGPLDLDAVRQAVLDICGAKFSKSRNVAAVFFQQAFRRGSAFETAGVIDSTLQQENQSVSAAFTRWVMGTALILGLAGTFVAFMQLVTGSGLLEALDALKDSAQKAAGESNLAAPYGKLSAAFSTVYEGFGHAFLASLAGLISTVVLGFVHTLFLARRKQRCFFLLEEFGDEVLRPLLTPGDAAPQLAEALRTASQVVVHSGDAVSSLRDAAVLLSSASEGFKATQGANSELITTLSNLAGQLEASRESWDTLLDALRDSRVSMKITVDEFKKEAASQRQESEAVAAAAVAGMRDVVTSLAAEIEKVAAAKVEHFQSVQSDVRRMVLDSKKDWKTASSAILAQTGEAFTMSLETVRKVIEDSQQEAMNARAELSQLASATTTAVVDHREILGRHAEALSDSLKTWGDVPARLTAAMDSLQARLDTLAIALTTLNKMPDRWEQRVLHPIATLSDKLDDAAAQSTTWSTTKRRLGRLWSSVSQRGRTKAKS